MGSAAELRTQWEAKVAAGGVPGGVHPADAIRMQDDGYIQRFLEQHDGDVSLALQMMVDTCAWRTSFGANVISEANINMDYIREGLFYPRGRDMDGCTIFIFKSKKHVKGQRSFDELMRCLVYWFERLDRIENNRQISVFFDMADTGLSNMDMEFTRYIITLFKLYYPDFLNYIFIYEMPWVLNAAFKVIKALLPAKAVAKMKFITKSGISAFVPLDQAQKSWGGNDDYTFSFVSANFPSANDTSIKKVTFADPSSPGRENAPEYGDSDGGHSMMKLSPRDTIVFKNDGAEVGSSFSLTNSHNGYIAYKIKTTAPEKTKVWPSVGVLASGKSEVIKLSLTATGQAQNAAAARIKFLIVCTPINTALMTPQELADLWKDMSKLSIEQHRLRCTVQTADFSKQVESSVQVTDNEKQITVLNQAVASIKTSQDVLDSQLKSLKTVQLVNVTLSALLLGLIIYFFRSYGQTSEAFGEFCNRP